MKIHFCFLTRQEIKNSNIWESYFKNSNFEFKISVYADINYEIKNYFFKKFQIQHNIFKSREFNVEIKYDFISKNKDDDFLIILPEDSLPLKSINNLYNYLINNNEFSIFSFSLDPHVSINDGRVKYGALRHFDFNEDLRYKNDDWICLSKKHSNIISENKEDVFCFNKPIGGEHFISSILNKNKELKNVKNKSFIYENWDGYNGRFPSIFSIQDEEKIKKIIETNSETFFLRKFEENINNEKIFFLNLYK